MGADSRPPLARGRAVLGAVYPAYRCFKTIERGSAEELKAWCVYWVVFAALDTLDNVTDQALFWLPFYYEAKLALVVYMWHPKFRGAEALYSAYVKPLLTVHERKIDQAIEDAGNKAKDLATSQGMRAVNYIRTASGSLLHTLQEAGLQAQSAGDGPARGVYAEPRSAQEAAANAFASPSPGKKKRK